MRRNLIVLFSLAGGVVGAIIGIIDYYVVTEYCLKKIFKVELNPVKF